MHVGVRLPSIENALVRCLDHLKPCASLRLSCTRILHAAQNKSRALQADQVGKHLPVREQLGQPPCALVGADIAGSLGNA